MGWWSNTTPENQAQYGGQAAPLANAADQAAGRQAAVQEAQEQGPSGTPNGFIHPVK